VQETPHSLFLVPTNNSVHHEDPDDDSEIDPVLETRREDHGDLHDVEDGPAEVGDKFEDLVFGGAGGVSSARRRR
jgi:hypothetical protein